jgi:predicted nucleic acid-binding protein
MNVLVDTSVWSLALRRKAADLSPRDGKLVTALEELIREGRVRIIGPIRQELLTGIREPERYRKVRNKLREFPEPSLDADNYEEAAHLSNLCRAKGISGSPVDFLVCAIAQRRRWQVFTTDRDFENYIKVIDLNTFSPF